jgi:Domain of unknown function (DUF222)
MAQPPVPEHGLGEEPARGPGLPGGSGARQDGDLGLADFASGGAGDGCLPGAELAAALAALSGPGWRCPGATDDELIGLLGRWAALESWAAAGKLGAVRELLRRRADDGQGRRRRRTPRPQPPDQPQAPAADRPQAPDEPQAPDRPQAPGGRRAGDDLPLTWEEGTGHEVASVLSVSLPGADKVIDLAWALGARLPRTGALLAEGTIDVVKAMAVARELAVLTDEQAIMADALIAPGLAGKTPGQAGRLAALAVDAIDPDGAQKRREYAEREDARVRFWRETSGASALAAYGLPTDAALSANANINQRASQYKKAKVSPGARMDQLRVLAFLDILNGIAAADRIAQAQAQAQDHSQAQGQGQPQDQGQDQGQGQAQGQGQPQDQGQGAASGGPGDDSPAGERPGPDDYTPGDRTPGDTDRNDQGHGGEAHGDGDPSDEAHADEDRGRQSPGDEDRGDEAHADEDRGRQSPGDEDRGGGLAQGGGGGGIPAGPPGQAAQPGQGLAASVNLTLPLATLLGLAEVPGDGHGLGPLDPALVRDLAAAASRSPHSRWCLTIVDPNGYAIGHGCARPARTSRTHRPADGTSGPAGNRDGPWALARHDQTGPPGGYGTWTLTLPSGRAFTVNLGPVPVTDCDHRHETDSYQPGDTLRHLVEIRDGTCTFPCCSRHARHCDFEHTIPHDQGGRTCACNGSARSRRCHRVKQSAGWSVSQPRPGWHQWTTPSGRTYTQGPMQYPA